MHASIHKDLAYGVIEAYPKKDLLEFLLLSMAKPNWRKKVQTRANRIKWLKEWMDVPDDSKHGSTARNDHSYKLKKVGNRFELVFGGSKSEQATVVARLKYDARDIKEWNVEEEYRISALELAICIHWIVDISSPSHEYSDCSQELHGKIEKDFDKLWKSVWSDIKGKINFRRKNQIKNVYRWAKSFIESKYNRNEAFIGAYKAGKTMLNNADCAKLSKEVIMDIAQNIADFLAFVDKKINYTKIYAKLKKELGQS